MRKHAPLAMMLLSTTPAVAAEPVAISSEVLLETRDATADGRARLRLAPIAALSSGDRLVYLLRYRNGGTAARRLVLTNPLPAAVALEDAPGAMVSIDGGRHWGQLADLRVALGDGRWRRARGGDVTHLRWALGEPVAAGAQGQIAFRGIVR